MDSDPHLFTETRIYCVRNCKHKLDRFHQHLQDLTSNDAIFLFCQRVNSIGPPILSSLYYHSLIKRLYLKICIFCGVFQRSKLEKEPSDLASTFVMQRSLKKILINNHWKKMNNTFVFEITYENFKVLPTNFIVMIFNIVHV